MYRKPMAMHSQAGVSLKTTGGKICMSFKPVAAPHGPVTISCATRLTGLSQGCVVILCFHFSLSCRDNKHFQWVALEC